MMASPNASWASQQAQERRATIIQAIVDLTEELGAPPLRTELWERTGYSHHTISKYLKAMAEDGTLTEAPRQGERSLRLKA